jgi:hypothetical protein
MVVRELLVAVRDAKLIQSPHEPAGTVKQIELIVLAAVDLERLQPTEIVPLRFDRDYRVLPALVRHAQPERTHRRRAPTDHPADCS